MQLESVLTAFLCSVFPPDCFPQYSSGGRCCKLQCVTELKTGNPHIPHLQGHWNYQGYGCSNDWVLVHKADLEHGLRLQAEGYFDAVQCPEQMDGSNRIFSQSDWSSNNQLSRRTSRNPDDVLLQSMTKTMRCNFKHKRDSYVPCSVLFFVYMPGESEDDSSPHVVLRHCLPDNAKERENLELKKWSTMHFSRWRKSYDDTGRASFCILPLRSLYERVLVFEDDPRLYVQNYTTSWISSHEGDTPEQLFFPRDSFEQSDTQDYVYAAHPRRFWSEKYNRERPLPHENASRRPRKDKQRKRHRKRKRKQGER